MIPMQNDESVKPGKYGPVGNISAPRISPNAYAMPAGIGPNRIAIITIGRKPNPIRRNCRFTDRNLVRIISHAIKIAIAAIFRILKSFFKCSQLLKKVSEIWQIFIYRTIFSDMPLIPVQ